MHMNRPRCAATAARVTSLTPLPIAAQADVKVALSNSFGFGGHNSCVLFRKFEE